MRYSGYLWIPIVIVGLPFGSNYYFDMGSEVKWCSGVVVCCGSSGVVVVV